MKLVAGGYAVIRLAPADAQLQLLPTLSLAEKQVALQNLQNDPSGLSNPPFDEEDVEVIGRYLTLHAGGQRHEAWERIMRGEPNAFAIALHEAREIEELVKAGANLADIFDVLGFFKGAHAVALIAEMQYWQEWARSQGFADVTIAALTSEAPFLDMSQKLQRISELARNLGIRIGRSGKPERDRAKLFYRTIGFTLP